MSLSHSLLLTKQPFKNEKKEEKKKEKKTFLACEPYQNRLQTRFGSWPIVCWFLITVSKRGQESMSLEIWGTSDCSLHEDRTQQLLALRPQPSPCRGWKHRLLSCLFGSRSDVPSQLSAHYTCLGKTFERMEWNDFKFFLSWNPSSVKCREQCCQESMRYCVKCMHYSVSHIMTISSLGSNVTFATCA